MYRHAERIAQVALVLGLVTVGWLSLAPSDSVPDLGLWDKLQHGAAYAALAVVGCVGTTSRMALLALAFGLVA